LATKIVAVVQFQIGADGCARRAVAVQRMRDASTAVKVSVPVPVTGTRREGRFARSKPFGIGEPLKIEVPAGLTVNNAMQCVLMPERSVPLLTMMPP